ncbi:MAG: IS1634 family transposase [Nitrospirae bacterium]|nr:IS1634 family transposase [Nitrospirota bacterium]
MKTLKRKSGKTAVQIVENYRRADSVIQKIIRHLGQAANDKELEELRRLAHAIMEDLIEERQPSLPLMRPENFKAAQPTEDTVKISNLREEQRVIDGIGDVFGKLFDDLGFGRLIRGTKTNAVWNETLKACVLARLANPSSKRRTAALLERDFGIRIPLNRIYRLMDYIAKHEELIRQQVYHKTMGLFQDGLQVLFFDVTALYFESFEEDGLRRFGFNCKFKETQVMLALVTTTSGLPVDYLLMPGDTSEGSTLIEWLTEFKLRHKTQVRLIADRAMFSEKNLEAMEGSGVNYVVAAKLRGMPKDIKEEILSEEGYRITVVEGQLQWYKEVCYKNRRLIVSFSAARAGKDASDRSRLIERLMKKQKNGRLKIKELIGNRGTSKYIRVMEESIGLDTGKIEADSLWDGIHGVITNALPEREAAELLTAYRGLWQIEEAFRVQKHDLKFRPVFHWSPGRIRAHIAICYIAYAIAKQALNRLELRQIPMSFERLRDELLYAQSSILLDISSKKRYAIASNVTELQRSIYQTFGLKRTAAARNLSP